MEEEKYMAVAKVLHNLNVDHQTAALIFFKLMKKDGLIDTFITYLREPNLKELTNKKMMDYLKQYEN